MGEYAVNGPISLDYKITRVLPYLIPIGVIMVHFST